MGYATTARRQWRSSERRHPPPRTLRGVYSRPAQARVGGHRSDIAVPFRSIIAPRQPDATGWCWWTVKVRARGRYRNQLISVDFLKTAILGLTFN